LRLDIEWNIGDYCKLESISIETDILVLAHGPKITTVLTSPTVCPLDDGHQLFLEVL
jgi:hypothetical protein